MKTPPTLKKSLLCTLTDEEQREYGVALATAYEDMERVEAEKKRQTDHFKDRIAGLQAKADELRRKVSTGQEWRDVECVVTYGVPMADRKTITRTDTGEVVETTWMTEAEKQFQLPLDDDGSHIVDCDIPADDHAIEVEAEHVETDPAETPDAAPPPYRVPPSTGYKTKKENAAFDAGFRAYSRDKDLETENPYDSSDLKKTAVSFAWADGWDNAALFVASGKSWRDEPLPTDDSEAPQPGADAEDY